MSGVREAKLCVYACVCVHMCCTALYLSQVAKYSERSLGFLQSDPVSVGRGNVSEKNREGLAGGHHLATLL